VREGVFFFGRVNPSLRHVQLIIASQNIKFHGTISSNAHCLNFTSSRHLQIATTITMKMC
jgi:hypothetical protein